MEKRNVNFLSSLFFERFKLNEREKRLMDTHSFTSDNEEIRNDQSITEARETSKIIDRLIDRFLDNLE